MPRFFLAALGTVRSLPKIGTALALLAASSLSVVALEAQSGEKEAILACERRLCTTLQQKTAAGEDLDCELSKTWVRSVIKGAEQPALKWGFGDARCSARIHISRALIAAAMTARGKDFKLWLPAHTATCIVEIDGQPHTVIATLAPKLILKDGKVEKIWVNLTGLEGPSSVKATLWTAAKLADDVGLFQWPMLKSVNRFIATTCPRKYPLPAVPVGKAP
jgi:hypothetical protein